MALAFHTLDVFTDRMFTGNPLAVVLDAGALDGAGMQTIAAEFNLSETVFVLPPEDSANTARLRIFTPKAELAFAGHPTVGAAVLLAELFGVADEVRLEEGVGLVPVKLEQRKGGVFAQFSAAVMPEPMTDVPSDKEIAEALGLQPQQIGFGTHRPSVFNPGNHPMLYVPLNSRETLKLAAVSMQHWPGLGKAGEFLLYAYCASEDDTDASFHARAFAPMSGIPEDPATGSAAAGFPGPLLSFEGPWQGTNAWVVMQGEDMGRSSRIELEADADGKCLSAVRVGGRAVRVSEGKLHV